MTPNEIFVNMALKAWNVQITRADKVFAELSDAALLKEIAPGKNRSMYLLGHLIAVNDGMLGLFSSLPRLYAHYDDPFVKNPDKSIADLPELTILRKDWETSKNALSDLFSTLTADEWMQKHSAMTEEDLVNDPGRNKLSVLLNRTNHLAYHLGQVVLAK